MSSGSWPVIKRIQKKCVLKGRGLSLLKWKIICLMKDNNHITFYFRSVLGSYCASSQNDSLGIKKVPNFNVNFKFPCKLQLCFLINLC